MSFTERLFLLCARPLSSSGSSCLSLLGNDINGVILKIINIFYKYCLWPLQLYYYLAGL